MTGVDLSTSAHVKRMMEVIQGKRDGADVVHVCPECGGDFAQHLSALIVVQACWACHGVGTLTTQQLDAYLSEANARARSITIR